MRGNDAACYQRPPGYEPNAARKHSRRTSQELEALGDEEAVKLKVEAVLHGGAIDLGHQPAPPSERRAVEPDAVTDDGKWTMVQQGMNGEKGRPAAITGIPKG
jgi:hypothetical protein